MKTIIRVLSLALAVFLFASTACADTSREAIELGIWPADFVRSNDALNHMTFYPGDETYLSYWQDCATPGTVEKLEYDTWYYAFDAKNGDALSHETPVTKSCYVYLPYGYDPAEKYDILYLLHGAGGDETSWFATVDNHNMAEVGQGTAVHILDKNLLTQVMENDIIPAGTVYSAAEKEVTA